MGKKEKRDKRSHTSKKNKLDTSKSRSRHKSRPQRKARPDFYDIFSTSDTSSTSSSDYVQQQSRHCKRHGTKYSRSDSSPDRDHIKKNKLRKRFEATTTDSESEVHVDTEVDNAVDSDNEPTPNLCHIEAEIENKTSSFNTVNLKLPDSTGKKKRNNKDDQRENSKTLSELWPKSNKYYEKINTEKESNSASLSKNILTEYFKLKSFRLSCQQVSFRNFFLILNQLLEIN